MKKTLLFILFLSLPIKAYAFLPLGIYYGFRGGINSYENEKNNINQKLKIKKGSPFVSPNIGIRFLDFRFELEYTYRYDFFKMQSLNKTKNIAAQNIMGNIYYNFLSLPLINFYVNGGIGETKFTGVPYNIIGNKNNFTWNLGFGTNLSILDIFNIDIGYRYVDMGNLKMINNTKIKQASHDVYAGIRFGF